MVFLLKIMLILFLVYSKAEAMKPMKVNSNKEYLRNGFNVANIGRLIMIKIYMYLL